MPNGGIANKTGVQAWKTEHSCPKSHPSGIEANFGDRLDYSKAKVRRADSAQDGYSDHL
jgi:hypothetical protein